MGIVKMIYGACTSLVQSLDQTKHRIMLRFTPLAFVYVQLELLQQAEAAVYRQLHVLLCQLAACVHTPGKKFLHRVRIAASCKALCCAAVDYFDRWVC
jgi:hypothetical protein